MAQRAPGTCQILDQSLKKNQRLLGTNQQLMGKMAPKHWTRSTGIWEFTVALDYLTGKKQQLREKNKQILGEIAPIPRELVEPSEAHTKVKARNIIAQIAAWFFSCVRRALG